MAVLVRFLELLWMKSAPWLPKILVLSGLLQSVVHEGRSWILRGHPMPAV